MAKRIRLNLGDVFSVETAKGFGVLQLVKLPTNNNEIELVKVFYDLFNELPTNLEELTKGEFYYLQIPLKYANNQKLTKRIGTVPLLDGFKTPKHFRTENPFGKGWNIINVDMDKYEHTSLMKLSREQKKYSPWGTISFPDLVERLEEGWRLENWELK